MIKKILLGADLGPFTSHMLIHLDSLAARLDASVHVVHAVSPLGELASAVVRSHCSEHVKKEVLASTHVTGLLETIRQEVYETFSNFDYSDNNLISRIKEVTVAPGTPASVILFEAERIGADLILVGSHGTESIDGRILGSVAAKVLQLSKIPVMLVPMMDPANMLGNTHFPLPSRHNKG